MRDDPPTKDRMCTAPACFCGGVPKRVSDRVEACSSEPPCKCTCRLCPSKGGTRKFADIMLRRLAKLGIDKTNPEDMTPEERSKFVR